VLSIAGEWSLACQLFVTLRAARSSSEIAMSPTQDPTAPGTTASAGSDIGGGARLGPDSLTDDQAPSQALKDIGNRLSELSEYVSYFLTAKVDGLKLTLRNVGIMAGLGVVGLMALGGFVITLMVMLLRGIAYGLGDLMGDRWWLGELLTAVAFLALMGVGVMIGLKKIGKSSRERTAKKYAARQQQERVKFGTDVHQRAQQPTE